MFTLYKQQSTVIFRYKKSLEISKKWFGNIVILHTGSPFIKIYK